MNYDRDPLFPFIVSSAPIKVDSALTQKWYRLLLLKEGSLRFTTARRVYSAGSILLFSPETAGDFRTSKGLSYGEIRFSDELVEEIDIRCWDDRFLALLQTLKESGEIVHAELDPRSLGAVARIFAEIDDEYRHTKDGYRTVIRLKLIELMVMIFRGTHGPAIPRQAQKPVWAMEDVIRHIQGNYTEEFSLQDLASQCGLNRSYFSRAFKDAAGTPLFEYINRLRIQKACLMLKRGNLPIVEIAFTVGYNNLSFFYRYFNRIMKMTPREYRAIAQK